MYLKTFLYISILITFFYLSIITWQVFKYAKKFSFLKRALLKQYVYDKIDPKAHKVVVQCLILVATCWLLINLLIINLTWATDLSFLLILLPIMSYFTIARFVVWDKEDILNRYNNK